MGADQNIDWTRAAASALDWWADAGVDVLVDDAPRNWLAEPAPVLAEPAGRRSAPARPPAAALPEALPETLPETMVALSAWRGGLEAPEARWPGAFVAASGPADARVMILIDCPERDEPGALLGGAAGRLFDRMLAAIGFTRGEVHLVPLCAKRPTSGRMPRETEARLGEIARHHLTLAAPERLLVMGDAASRAILSTSMTEARGRLHDVNHKSGKKTSVVASFHPRFLLEKPACKADAWKDLRMLIGGQK